MTTTEDRLEPERLDPINGSFQTWRDAIEAMSVGELIPELQRAMLRLDEAGEKFEEARSDVWRVTLRLRDASAAEERAVTMAAINPEPGDNWCNLTEDELLAELRRGLDWAFKLEDELMSAHNHVSLAAYRLRDLRGDAA